MVEYEILKDDVNLIRQLSEIPMFEPFDKKELQGLLRVSANKLRKYEPGEMIIEEGDYDPYMYFLVSGKVKIVKNGKELSIIRRRGDVFGEMGIISGATRSASAYAVDETTCMVIDTSSIEKLTGTDRLAFGYVLFRILADILASRLRDTTDELIKAKEEIARLKKCLPQKQQTTIS